MANILEMIGIVGIFISAIPTGVGFLFVILAILTRPNHTGMYHDPIKVLIYIVKNPKQVEYGGKIFFKWGVLLVMSILLVKNFGGH